MGRQTHWAGTGSRFGTIELFIFENRKLFVTYVLGNGFSYTDHGSSIQSKHNTGIICSIIYFPEPRVLVLLKCLQFYANSPEISLLTTRFRRVLKLDEALHFRCQKTNKKNCVLSSSSKHPFGWRHGPPNYQKCFKLASTRVAYRCTISDMSSGQIFLRPCAPVSQ